MTTSILWLLAGALFICVEIFGMPGIGFLFAGIAALVVGGAIEAGLLTADATLIQFVLFFAITIISAALLWKKLKRTPNPTYHNIIGTEAVVSAPGLSGTQIGQVQWSGTIMRARLVDNAPVDVLPEGSVVTVRHTEGNVLYVTPRTH
ncbi:MAG: NfeD family protein [Pseudomonadota bacterium]